MPDTPLRALVVSYSFPPVGGAGVARVTKLAKFLPEHGVTPTVLTVSNPSVPLLDHSRDHDISPEMSVLRLRTLEPGYAAKQVAWRAKAGGAPTAKQRARSAGAVVAVSATTGMAAAVPGKARICRVAS